jgi:hypothetical protein
VGTDHHLPALPGIAALLSDWKGQADQQVVIPKLKIVWKVQIMFYN